MIRVLQNLDDGTFLDDKLRPCRVIDAAAVYNLKDPIPQPIPEGYAFHNVRNPFPEPIRMEDQGCEIVGLTTSHYMTSKTLAVMMVLWWQHDDLTGPQTELEAISVNLVDPAEGNSSAELPEGQFYGRLKSHIEPYLMALIGKGVVDVIPGVTAKSGFVEFPACRLTTKGQLWVEWTGKVNPSYGSMSSWDR